MPRKPKTIPLRCFVGIKFPLLQQIQPLLTDLTKLSEQKELKLRVALPQNLHLTLKFLGAVSEDQEIPLQSILSQIGDQLGEFTLECQGVSFFKNSICLGIENSGPLQELVYNLNEALAHLGFEKEEKEYSPHVTVARFAAAAKPHLLKLAKPHETTRWGMMPNTKFHLYRSHTLPEGAKYFILGKYDLAGNAS